MCVVSVCVFVVVKPRHALCCGEVLGISDGASLVNVETNHDYAKVQIRAAGYELTEMELEIALSQRPNCPDRFSIFTSHGGFCAMMVLNNRMMAVSFSSAASC